MKLKNILAIILLLSLSKTIVAQTNKEEKDTATWHTLKDVTVVGEIGKVITNNCLIL